MTPAPTRARFRPALPLRAANRMLRPVVGRGKGPGFMRLLTVIGRRSGLPRTTPVVPVRRDGTVWVVSPYGDVDWVRNVRAAGQLELSRGDDRISYTARELDSSDAVPVLRAYLSMPSERFVRGRFDVTADSTDDAIAAEAPRHPVFALTTI